MPAGILCVASPSNPAAPHCNPQTRLSNGHANDYGHTHYHTYAANSDVHHNAHVIWI